MLTPLSAHKGGNGVNRAGLPPASLGAGKSVGGREEAWTPPRLNPTRLGSGVTFSRSRVGVVPCWESGCFQDFLIFKGIARTGEGPFTPALLL